MSGTRETLIKGHAFALGFDLAGIVRLGPSPSAPRLRDWLARGFAGDMAYMANGEGKRADSRLVRDGMRSAVVVAMDYGGRQPAGPVARYARGEDYHLVLGELLDELLSRIRSDCGDS